MNDFPEDAAIFYDQDMSDGLERALQLALSSDLDAMGQAAKRHVAQFAWSDVGERLDALYAALVAREVRV